ncbi:Hydroxymethylpyrimidine phosphate kinase ThiD [Caenispirillum salinarum AK4]|uniref:hydroxymethylpyrimidine kinase n=1 Tax=Caenispirillum salinarum AK4 TaxID=1238182 RepID=K9H1C7_9PROT|nr:bifunctional hydroxymethylpyrimidine kinase/phosphomethylpyrimidine kinase [Caenispirillum salinarum]EKV31367.1 Hydroxymethylpyrimidine phosphate kinase ThiD [Caenispirillum salinarum AK4]
MQGRVLIVAGSDSGGGAGIQADTKTVTALQGFAMTAITALTAQNTCGVHGVHPVPGDFIRQQIQVCMTDIGADVVKIGMLGDAPTIETVAQALEDFAPDVPLVVDPVMVAKGGHPLLAREAVTALKGRLITRATVITPNLPEAETLLGREVRTLKDMEAAADDLLALGPKAVLLKGGHLAAEEKLVDLLITAEGVTRFESGRVATTSTHGTGCTLASAVATGLAQGRDLTSAVSRAREYVLGAIRTAPGYGQGHGPLDHAHTVRPFERL